MGNFGFVIVGVIALDIFIWVWLIISDKKTLIHYDFLPRTKESLDAEVRNAIVKIDTNNSSHCRYCGAEMAPGSKYCGICGKSQSPKQSKYFSSGHKGTIKQVNQWLAENPNVKNVTMNVELGKGIGAFTYRSVITSIELQYEIDKECNPYQYAVVEVKRHSGWYTFDANKAVNKWKENNPAAQVVCERSTIWERNGSAHNAQIYMLIKSKEEQEGVDENTSKVNYKRNKKWLIVLCVLIALAVGGITYVSSLPRFTGTGSTDGLILSVDQPFSRIMKINYQNTAANDFSLGWVDKSAEVVAVTDKGEYSGKIVGAFGNDSKLKHGKKGFFLAIFKDIDGNVEQLNFNGILYLKDDGLPEHNTGFGNMSDKEAQVQLLITHNNGDTSTNLLSENPDTETAENQNTEVTTEESKQQYKVTTGGTRLNIRKEPRADAEVVQKLEDGTVCEASGNKSEDGSWIEVIIPESDQTGWASAQYLTEIPEEQSINVGGQEMSVDEAEDGNSEQVPEKSQSEEVNQVQQMQEWMQSEEVRQAQQQMQEWMQSEEGQRTQQQMQDMLNSMMNQ